MGEGPGGRTTNVGLRRSHPTRNFPRARARLRARFQGSSPDSPGSWCAAGDQRRRGDPSGGRSRSLARWGWRGRASVRLTGVPQRPGSQKGDQEGPVGHIPGTGRGGHLESRPRKDAVAQTKLGRRDARSVGPRVRAPPAAARHYLHEDSEEQGSDPDLDGQLPHGAAGAAPGAAAADGALGGSRSSTGAGSPDPGRRGRRAAGRGRGREAGAGRGRALGRAQPKPPAADPGARGRRARRSPPRLPTPSWGRPGDSPRPGAERRLRALVRALRPRPREGRGSPGKPRRRLPCAFPGSPASGRPLRSAPGAARSLGPRLRLLCGSRLRCLLPLSGLGLPAHARTWAGGRGALGDSRAQEAPGTLCSC